MLTTYQGNSGALGQRVCRDENIPLQPHGLPVPGVVWKLANLFKYLPKQFYFYFCFVIFFETEIFRVQAGHKQAMFPMLALSS